jgi:hypothetical protein
MKGIITAAKVGSKDLPVPVRAVLLLLRPLLLALAGIVLAGRWATAALAWTACVLAATRQSSGNEGWWWWYAGALGCFAISGLVETRVKPVRSVWRTVPPYLVTTSGIVVGALFLTNQGWIRNDLPTHDVRWMWLLPALSATMAALSLLFWTAAPTALGLSALVGGWYGWIAYAAIDPKRTRPWPIYWPFHSIWIAWLVAIVVVPIVIGRLPAKLITPRSRTT